MDRLQRYMQAIPQLPIGNVTGAALQRLPRHGPKVPFLRRKHAVHLPEWTKASMDGCGKVEHDMLALQVTIGSARLVKKWFMLKRARFRLQKWEMVVKVLKTAITDG